MKITKIEPASDSRYTVYVDGEYFYIFDAEIIAAFSLKEGMECNGDMLNELMEAGQARKARERALYLLEYRNHSYCELVKKLERSVSEEIAIKTADEMARLGFLDDRRYCKELAQNYINFKKWGAYRVKAELAKKGFSRELIDETLEECLEKTDSLTLLKELVERKYKEKLMQENGERKVAAALARLGWGYDDIKEVILEYIDEMEMEG